MIPTENRLETFAWFAVLFALCAGVVWVRTATVKATYRYVQQERELSLIGLEIQDLRIRWLKQTAPKRLELLANKFDLHPATSNQRVQYSVKGTLH